MIYPFNIVINTFNISILLIKSSKAIFMLVYNLNHLINFISKMTKIHLSYYMPNHDTKYSIKHCYHCTYQITSCNNHIYAYIIIFHQNLQESTKEFNI